VAIQRALAALNAALPAHRRMEFRIGINLGDVVIDQERLYGDDVNLAARLEGLAEGGGICISGTVYDQIETKLGLRYTYLGERMARTSPGQCGSTAYRWGLRPLRQGRLPGGSLHAHHGSLLALWLRPF
jgi:class 3 adenylate cyclase